MERILLVLNLIECLSWNLFDLRKLNVLIEE